MMSDSMIWNLFLCLVMSFDSVVRSGGHNGCKDKNWHYHDRTHTCFRLFRNRYSWNYSKQQCQRYWGAPDYKSQGHLAKIDDEETNTFVKGVLASDREAWIGLYTEGQWRPFRWEGYPNEEVAFSKFETTPDTRTSAAAYITSSFWKTSWPNNGRYFICQSKAEIPRTSITCPPAIRQNQKLNQPITCKFYFNTWKTVSWFRAGTALASCSSDPRSCHNRIRGFEATLNGKTAFLRYNGAVSRDLEDELKCEIRMADNTLLDTKRCDLQVYEPPTSIDCRHELTRSELHVICTTAKIYPEASCKWLYKNQDETSFKTVSGNEARNESHEEFSDSTDGYKYFRSQCSVNLTSKGTEFKAGSMSVKVIMYPTVKSIELSSVENALVQYEEEVVIELPQKPVFKINKEETEGMVTILEDVDITVICQVKSGQPTVLTTTFSCEFPITKSGGTHNTWKGISYYMKRTVDRSMDGKTCTCWGNHITGRSEESTLHFNVSYPASVISFRANERQTQLTVDLATQVQLQCQTSGKPLPAVDILKTDKGVEEIIKSGQNVDELKASFQAKCVNNGKYSCRTSNMVMGRMYEDNWNLDIHVACFPIPCDGQDANPSFIASVGDEMLVELCAVGYPKPNDLSFYLQKSESENIGKGKMVFRTKYTLEYLFQGSNTITGIRIKFHRIEQGDHGNYTLLYLGTTKNPGSKLHFQLSSKGPPDCPMNVTVLHVGYSSVWLSWLPGHDNGFNQTFVLTHHNVITSQETSVKEVRAQGTNEVTYFNLTGLYSESEYFIRVDAYNQVGNISCPGNAVNFSTGMPPKALTGEDTNSSTIIAVVCTILIVIIIIIVVVIAVFFVRKRKYQDFNYRQASYSASGAGKGDSGTFDSNNKVMVNVGRGANTENASLTAQKDETEENVFSSEDHDYPYNNVRENVYNNVGRNEETEYANTAAINRIENPGNASPPSSPSPPTVEFESRRNQDGLIYMDVVIDPTDQRPKIMTDQTEKPRPPSEEPVEYSSIDYLATAEVNSPEDECPEDPEDS